MSVAHLTQRLFLLLLISNLQSSRGVALLLSPFTQSLANIILHVSFDRVLPSMGGTYNLACCILTKVSKSWVYMTNN
jgi:hypothetical protein